MDKNIVLAVIFGAAAVVGAMETVYQIYRLTVMKELSGEFYRQQTVSGYGEKEKGSRYRVSVCGCRSDWIAGVFGKSWFIRLI